MPCSSISFTSIDANPKIALVGRPSDVAIDSGSAKKARYASEFPSIRNSSCGVSPLDATEGHTYHARGGRRSTVGVRRRCHLRRYAGRAVTAPCPNRPDVAHTQPGSAFPALAQTCHRGSHMTDTPVPEERTP